MPGRQRRPCVDLMTQHYDFVDIEENVRASKMTYAEARITNPRNELSVAEEHDCFIVHEMVNYEDVGWIKRDRGMEHIETETFRLTGRLPVNTDLA